MKAKGTSRLMLVPMTIVMLLFCAALLFPVACCHDRPSTSTGAQDLPIISLSLVAQGFTSPVHITHADDGSGRMFVVEQTGLVKIIKNGSVLPAPFLDVSTLLKSSSGEQGLLSMAFPPGYGPTNPSFYIDYTGTQGVGDTVVARYRTSADPDLADPASGQTLLTIVQPYTNHNGGLVVFGPDGYLYIGTGDGGSGGDPLKNAQNPLSLLGKILRIDVSSGSGSYAVPPDNPFSGTTGYLPEIWDLGLRNPWRFSFDRQTGDLYIADVGQNTYEEVDVEAAPSGGGYNYGWNIMEGRHCYGASSCDQAGLVLPAAEYEHGSGDCSITGGAVYRGREFSALQGVYLYGDYCTGRIWGLRRSGAAWESRLLLDSDLLISTFGDDDDGNLYVADHSGGAVYKIVAPPAAP